MDVSELLFNQLRIPQDGLSPEQWLVQQCQIELQGVERLHFDFKEKDDTRTAILGEPDIKNLAKGVSGFANSAGGVLIWGINDKVQPKPITDVNRFLGNLLRRSTSVTTPVVPGIDGCAIASDADPTAGYALIYIPESVTTPHRVIATNVKVQDHYFVRSADSFVRATHVQLEDMFGRRPRPVLELTFEANHAIQYRKPSEIRIKVLISNTGRGVAKYPYVKFHVDAPYTISDHGFDGNGRHPMKLIADGGDARTAEYGSEGGCVVHSGSSIGVNVLRDRRHGEVPNLSPLRVTSWLAAEGFPLTFREYIFCEDELRGLIFK